MEGQKSQISRSDAICQHILAYKSIIYLILRGIRFVIMIDKR